MNNETTTRRVTILSYRELLSGVRQYVAVTLTADDAAAIAHAARRLARARDEMREWAALEQTELSAHLRLPGVTVALLPTYRVADSLRGLDAAREFVTLDGAATTGEDDQPARGEAADWVILSTAEPDVFRVYTDAHGAPVNLECLRQYFWLDGWLCVGFPGALVRAEAELVGTTATAGGPEESRE
jgi:hypothetical protein